MSDEEHRGWLCPVCGDLIKAAVVTDPQTATLAPCGHNIAADHPILSSDQLVETREEDDR
ncbi:hypothetical protein [Haladaptatus salinisoli]|uniref:hypothetical protein n=1 Tax=Haladaptatus salinisoli TaxID=2884876 RepID=UPI001D0B39E2|nr:hypothetical protein [Haladaptatus salinisoli]